MGLEFVHGHIAMGNPTPWRIQSATLKMDDVKYFERCGGGGYIDFRIHERHNMRLYFIVAHTVTGKVYRFPVLPKN